MTKTRTFVATCIALVLIYSGSVLALTRLLPSEQNTIDVFKNVSPLVVNVHNVKNFVNPFLDEVAVQTGKASGFIWDRKGYVVTNFHVVYQASRLAITLANGEQIGAKLVGADPGHDVAVLKIKDKKALRYIKNLVELNVANSDELVVGQKTIAIGNPFGLDNTVTTGIVSALGRQVPGFAHVEIDHMIQTDASINPGNSGGPLLDSAGELIGMNTMIFSNSGSSAGIGFALPANTIKRIVSQIIRYGYVKRPGLGLQLVQDPIAHELGVSGVIIAKVIAGTPAARAGLRGTQISSNKHVRLGDIIVAINGKRVRRYNDLYSVLNNIKVGDRVTLKYIRDGKTHSVKITTKDLSKSR